MGGRGLGAVPPYTTALIKNDHPDPDWFPQALNLRGLTGRSEWVSELLEIREQKCGFFFLDGQGLAIFMGGGRPLLW